VRCAALVLALVCAVVSPPTVMANDSSAELAAGGLVLTRHADIEMRSEDLFISAREVRVRYLFANTGAKDASILVAFPMPDITTEGYDDILSVPTENPTNFLAFATTVDGKPVVAQAEQKAIKNGVDRTAYLRGLGVPLAPHLRATNAILDGLPQARKDELVSLGLAVIDEYDVGKGMVKHVEATWTLKTAYYWRQTFPAGREITVEHRYKPSVGESAGTSWGSPGFAKEPTYAERRAHYCVDDDFLASIARAAKAAHQDYPPLTEQRIEYILTTGANWKAPIGDFHMVIDKGAAANLVSFCGEGVKKISPTRFEVRRANFTPTREVSILILKPMGAN
jgi:hypothetical protein